MCMIEDAEAKRQPVRIIDLKSRQVGGTTFFKALGHHHCQFKKQANAMCIAHLSDSTKEIFHIIKRYQENLPEAIPLIAPAKMIGNSIRWKHGARYQIQTQGSTDAARGSTWDFLHLSEVALWHKRRRSTTDEDALQMYLAPTYSWNRQPMERPVLFILGSGKLIRTKKGISIDLSSLDGKTTPDIS